MFSTILVPLDGSALAEQAVPSALELARRYHTKVILLRATAPPDRAHTPPDFGGAHLIRMLEAEEAGIAAYLKAWREKVEAQGVSCRTVHRLEEPSRAIVAEAEASEVDLIVMASHGRGGLDRWLHGSVAEKVLRRTPCPLLLVRVGPGARQRVAVPAETEPVLY